METLIDGEEVEDAVDDAGGEDDVVDDGRGKRVAGPENRRRSAAWAFESPTFRQSRVFAGACRVLGLSLNGRALDF